LTSRIASCDPWEFDEELRELSFEADTVRHLMDAAIPTLYSNWSGKQTPNALERVRKLLTFVDDAYVFRLVAKMAASIDPRHRIFGIRLMPIVTDPARLRGPVRRLAADPIAAVRVQLISALPSLSVDMSTIESVLKAAAYDRAEPVRRAAARTLWMVAPHLVAEYSSLLQGDTTAQTALEGLRSAVATNGLSAVYDALTIAIQKEPDRAATALLETIGDVPPGELALAMLCAERLATNLVFLRNLFAFARACGDMRRFARFIDVKRAPLWRDRVIMLQQAILFVPAFGDGIVESALQFAQDDVAIVRNWSVRLWVELIRNKGERAESIQRMIANKWQTRLVAAKIIREIGAGGMFEALADRLSRDEVENVRFCMQDTAVGE
jgi:hypothetical protein